MATKSELVTAQELLDMPDDGYRYELVRGVLVKMAPAGAQHGEIALSVGASLRNYVRANGLGKAYAAETGFLIGTDPDHVRAPDTAFVRQELVEAAGKFKATSPEPPTWPLRSFPPTTVLPTWRKRLRTGWPPDLPWLYW